MLETWLKSIEQWHQWQKTQRNYFWISSWILYFMLTIGKTIFEHQLNLDITMKMKDWQILTEIQFFFHKIKSKLTINNRFTWKMLLEREFEFDLYLYRRLTQLKYLFTIMMNIFFSFDYFWDIFQKVNFRAMSNFHIV